MIRSILTLTLSLVALLVVLPVIAILLLFWVFHLFVNGIIRLLGGRAVSWAEVLQEHSEIGWKPRPNLNTVYLDRCGDPATIKTDFDGWVGDCSIEESDIVVFGDSFAFGYGASTNRAYYALTNQCRVKGIGAPGYNMVQEVLLMKEYADRLKGKTVVWFVYPENDLAENLNAFFQNRRYPNPFVTKKKSSRDWEIVAGHVKDGGWIVTEDDKDLKRLFANLCTASEYSDRVFSAADFLVREAKRICDDAGAKLVIFSIPCTEQLSPDGKKKLERYLSKRNGLDLSYPDKRISEICREYGVEFVAGTSLLSLKDYKRRDNHWNRSGNRKVGAFLDRVFAES